MTPDTAVAENPTLNYFTHDAASIENRLQELNKEWDLERVHDLNASFSALNGTLLGKLLDKHFTDLPFTTSTRLVNETKYEYTPPIEMFKALGYRPKEEIEKEKQLLHSLKVQTTNEFMYIPAAVA
jgi:hypothetical protein